MTAIDCNHGRLIFVNPKKDECVDCGKELTKNLKCRVQFKGNIILHDLHGFEPISFLRKMAKDHVQNQKFMLSDFRFKFDNENESGGNENEANKK